MIFWGGKNFDLFKKPFDIGAEAPYIALVVGRAVGFTVRWGVVPTRLHLFNLQSTPPGMELVSGPAVQGAPGRSARDYFRRATGGNHFCAERKNVLMAVKRTDEAAT